MSAAVQTTFPPGPGTNCTDLSFADLSKQLEEDLHTTATATLVSAVISTLGSLYVLLFAALRCRERRQKQRRSGLKQRWSEWCAMHSTTVIVLNVTVSCLCISLLLITESSWTLSNISNRHEWQIQERGTCSFFAFLVQLLQWAVMCWNICISIVYTNVGQRSQKWLFVTVSAAVVWTIAVLMAAVPMSLDAYGVSPVNWCWIRRDETSQQHFEWYFFYAEVLVALVVVFVFLSVNTIKAVRRSKATGFARGNRNFARIMFFPLAFLLSYLGGLVNVFNEQIGGCPTVGLGVVHTVSYGLQGFFFAIAFVATQNGVPAWVKRCLGGKSGLRSARESFSSRPMSFVGMQMELPSSDPHILSNSLVTGDHSETRSALI